MTNFWVLNLEPLTVQTLLIILVIVTLLGSVLALAYIFTHRKDGYDPSMLFTLLIMPLVVSVIVMLVSNNLARAFSLAGVFTLVRFRLAMRDASDLAYILAAVGIGLSLALGYVLLGIIITFFLSIVLTLFSSLILFKGNPYGKLILDIPEGLHEKGKLESVIQSYTRTFKLDRIKTQEGGSQYKLTYKVQMNPKTDSKTLIDAVKEVNGGLEVSLQEDYKK
jgi:hypothetical protein